MVFSVTFHVNVLNVSAVALMQICIVMSVVNCL